MSTRDDNTPPEYTQDETSINEQMQKGAEEYNNFKKHIAVIKKAGKSGNTYALTLEDKTLKSEPGVKIVKESWMPTKKMEDYMHEKKITTMNYSKNPPKVERKPIMKIWLDDPLRTKYIGDEFIPVPNKYVGDLTLKPTKDHIFNSYLGMSVTPKQGNCEPIKNHIRDSWCTENESAYNYVLNWFARMLQKPEEPARTVIVLKGGQGTGKNVILNIFMKIFATCSMMCTKTEAFTGRFNEHLGKTKFLFSNEAVWGGNKQSESTIKSIITDDSILIEVKFGEQRTVTNRLCMVMVSNEDWVVPLGADDRRFLILDLDDKKHGKPYFDALLRNIYKEGGMEAFMDFLLKRNISNFDITEIPYVFSKTKLDNKIRNRNSVEKWLIHTINTIHAPYDKYEDPKTVDFRQRKTRVNLVGGWDNGPIEVANHELYEAYVMYCSKERNSVKQEISYFTLKLKEILGPYGFDVLRKRIDGNRVRMYRIPELSECEKAIQVALNERFNQE